MDWPGVSTVNASSLPTATALAGTYLTLIPVKDGTAPAASLIANVSAGSLFNGPLGSFSSFKVSSPVFVTVVTTLRFWTPSTESGPETCRESPGAAEAAIAERTRPERAVRTMDENITKGE